MPLGKNMLCEMQLSQSALYTCAAIDPRLCLPEYFQRGKVYTSK